VIADSKGNFHLDNVKRMKNKASKERKKRKKGSMPNGVLIDDFDR
jgi:hypothetical protein